MTLTRAAVIVMLSLTAAVVLLLGALHVAEAIARAQVAKIERLELDASLTKQ